MKDTDLTLLHDRFDLPSYDLYDLPSYDEDEYDLTDSMDEDADEDNDDDRYARRGRKARKVRTKGRKPQAGMSLSQIFSAEEIAKLKTFAQMSDIERQAFSQLIAERLKQATPSQQASAQLNQLLLAPKPNLIGSNIGAVADRVGGVLRPYYSRMVSEGTTFIGVGNGGRVALLSGILRHPYPDLGKFLNDASVAVQNVASKEVAKVAVDGTNPTVANLTVQHFGALIRVQDKYLDADYRPIVLAMTYAGFTQTLVLSPYKPIFEVMAILPADNGGLGLIQRVTASTFTIATAGARTGLILSVESLNARDI